MKEYIHKKCGGPMVKKDGMFFYRGRYFSGLVCEPCNSLHDDPEDSFHEHVGVEPQRDLVEARYVDSIADEGTGSK